VDVRAGDDDEAPGVLLGAAELADLGVDERDEVEVAPVEVVREAAAVTLSWQGQVADDAAAIGLEDDALDPALHRGNRIGSTARARERTGYARLGR
jgi:hypothetical protein